VASPSSNANNDLITTTSNDDDNGSTNNRTVITCHTNLAHQTSSSQQSTLTKPTKDPNQPPSTDDDDIDDANNDINDTNDDIDDTDNNIDKYDDDIDYNDVTDDDNSNGTHGHHQPTSTILPTTQNCLHIPDLDGHLHKIDALQHEIQQLCDITSRVIVACKDFARKLTMPHTTACLDSPNLPLLTTPDPPKITNNVIISEPVMPETIQEPNNNPCCKCPYISNSTALVAAPFPATPSKLPAIHI